MYRFCSSKDKKSLHKAYRGLYIQDLDKKWKKKVEKEPLLADAMLPGMTPKKLLVTEFCKLVDVYRHYINYIRGLQPADQTKVQNAAKSVFNYKSHAPKIAKFLLDPKNQFTEIHNCVYCDEVKVSVVHHMGRGVRRFDLDHVLDKGECPLTALSLYNFVPSCETCNDPPFKGVKTIGDTPDEMKKLSPTNPTYDFEHNVQFVVNPKSPNVWAIHKAEHKNDYEIDFKYNDITYSKSVVLFGLKSRYNEDFLPDALRYLDLLEQNPPTHIKNLADEAGRPYEEVREEIYENYFKIEFDRKQHSPYRKAKEDILGINK